ncbi:MAG: FtsW/RodA/SpoVE family cell cycle protein [Lachnospiraceae bacterium]|jgi:rod shape determining protein RodA|nr:FtsW/RodA/SpoVE family cell cycle protein [Lachnospiraceae bacterium]
MFRGYKIWDFDFKLVLMLIAISVMGVMVVGSARESYQDKQVIGVVAGVLLMIVVSFFHYGLILKLYWLIYGANLVLLSMVLLMGEERGGATRWLILGAIQFQPSETAKIMLILFFAQFIMKHRAKFNTFRILSLCIILIAIPWIMIFRQPDLSTSMVLLMLIGVILFSGGISIKLVITFFALLIPSAAILISLAMEPDSTILKDYQKTRILAFVNPEEYATQEAYQQLNSVTAIASGQLDGKGYKNNEITSVINGNFVSKPQTDFIFAVVGEEFGFKGSVILISLLSLISLECISIARKSKDLAGTIIAAGMGGLVAIQSFINIGVATFLLPNTGLPLPFVSAGLTSQLSLFIGMGVVLNVRTQAKIAERNQQ